MATIGDIVIYTNTPDERAMFQTSDTEWPGIVVRAFSSSDCLITVFAASETAGGVMPKRCNEDTSETPAEGTWRLK